MTAQRRPARVSACAIHWLHVVLPLVPVTPIIHSRALGCAVDAARDLAGVRGAGPRTPTFGTRHAGSPAKPARLPQHARRAARDRLRDVVAPVAAPRPDRRRRCRRGCTAPAVVHEPPDAQRVDRFPVDARARYRS